MCNVECPVSALRQGSAQTHGSFQAESELAQLKAEYCRYLDNIRAALGGHASSSEELDPAADVHVCCLPVPHTASVWRLAQPALAPSGEGRSGDRPTDTTAYGGKGQGK